MLSMAYIYGLMFSMAYLGLSMLYMACTFKKCHAGSANQLASLYKGQRCAAPPLRQIEKGL